MNGDLSLLLDTNIVIGFLNGDKIITSFLSTPSKNQKIFTVSQITRMELLGFPNITLDEEIVIKQFLDQTIILALSDEIADKVIELRKKTRLKLPDAIIVATALMHQLKLITCDEQLIKSTPALLSINPNNI
jgi:predicted nucleic acid-binding protein